MAPIACASPPTPPLLDARDLHVHLGSSHILQGVSLTIRPAEAVCLVGRNGMGKTTTLRSLLGLAPLSQGTLRLHGRVMNGSPPHRMVRQGLGWAPEDRRIFPTLSVRENLLLPARAGRQGQRSWCLERVLELFPRLAERLRHDGHHLSGGEQQMLSIGRALMTNPDLLILDEATEGLAPRIRDEIWQVICTLRESGMAILLVDKNVPALLALCDRVLVMVKGRIVLAEPAQDLVRDPEPLLAHLTV